MSCSHRRTVESVNCSRRRRVQRLVLIIARRHAHPTPRRVTRFPHRTVRLESSARSRPRLGPRPWDPRHSRRRRTLAPGKSFRRLHGRFTAVLSTFSGACLVVFRHVFARTTGFHVVFRSRATVCLARSFYRGDFRGFPTQDGRKTPPAFPRKHESHDDRQTDLFVARRCRRFFKRDKGVFFFFLSLC